MKGIDVSENNGCVDWQAVNEAGYGFAIIRLGYGNCHIDGSFTDNVNGAIAAGLKVGVYYYSYALDVEAAKAEAQFAKAVLQEYGVVPDIGVWFDMEDADGYKAGQGMPDDQTITSMCVAFVSEVNEVGYQCGVYASYNWLVSIIDRTQLDGVPLWNAQWGDNNDISEAKIWQFTDNLEIGGRLFDGNEYFN